jgi:hypothetical protein
MPVKVRCPQCQTEFNSPVQFDKASFENPTNVVTEIGTFCPKGHPMTFEKSDMHWSDL